MSFQKLSEKIEVERDQRDQDQKEYDRHIRHDHFEFKDQVFKISVTKGQRGAYGWEITVTGKTIDEAVNLAIKCDKKLRKAFMEEEG